MDIKTIYKEIFDEAVFENFRLKSNKFNELWEDISIEFDLTIAGPLYSIYKDSNWSYVYNDKENRFDGVDEIEAMRKWINTHLSTFKERLLSCKPEDEDEKEDREVLKSKVNSFDTILKIAIEIQSEYEKDK